MTKFIAGIVIGAVLASAGSGRADPGISLAIKTAWGSVASLASNYDGGLIYLRVVCQENDGTWTPCRQPK